MQGFFAQRRVRELKPHSPWNRNGEFPRGAATHKRLMSQARAALECRCTYRSPYASALSRIARAAAHADNEPIRERVHRSGARWCYAHVYARVKDSYKDVARGSPEGLSEVRAVHYPCFLYLSYSLPSRLLTRSIQYSISHSYFRYPQFFFLSLKVFLWINALRCSFHCQVS